MPLTLRVVQTEKKASRPSGRAVLLVSSGVALNSDLRSLHTSTYKRCVTSQLWEEPRCSLQPLSDRTCYQFFPVSRNSFRSIRSLTWVFYFYFYTFTVPLGRVQAVIQVGDRAHDATIGGHLADTCKECTQNHAGRAGGHLVITFAVSWSTMGGITATLDIGF